MANFFARLFSRTTPEPQVKVILRDPLRLTVEDFRRTPELVLMAANVLRDPRARQMLDTLRASHMLRYVHIGTTTEERAHHLSRCEGYTLALNDFEALGTLVKKREEQLEATFEPREEIDPTDNLETQNL